MNNVWTVALKTPCSGLTFATSAHCTQCIRRPILNGFVFRASPIGTLARSFSSVVPRNAKNYIRASRPKRPLQNGATLKSTPQNESQSVRSTKAQVNLSESQVRGILGPGLSFDESMQVLQEVQYRRVTGSLSDKGLSFPDSPNVTSEHAKRALNWLREEHPVDEEAAAAEYAEEELDKIKKEYEARSMKLGIYKRDESANSEQEESDLELDETYSQTPIRPDRTRDITSGSALEARKEYVETSKKIQAREAETAAAEAEARGEKLPETARDVVVAKKTALESANKEKYERWQRMANEAELKEEDILANRSAFSRLWAPILFGLTVAGLSWAYAFSYEPPKSSMRLFSSITPAAATIAAFASANFLFFVMWRYPPAWKMMNRNFLLSPGHPNPWSVVCALFSHQSVGHLMWNMAILYAVGVPVHQEIGRGAFIALFLTSGTLGYLTSLTFNVATKSFLSATLGASSGIFGLLGAYFALSETRTIGFLGFGQTDFQSWYALAGLLGYELIRFRMTRGIIDGSKGGSDHLTHIGGLVVGSILGFLIKNQLEREREEDKRVLDEP